MDPAAARSTSEWRRLDAAHHLRPSPAPLALAAAGGTRILVEGHGVHVVDSDGGRFLDATAGRGAVVLGYGRADLVDAAHRQLGALPHSSSSAWTTTPAAVDLARRVADRAPRGLRHVVFASSGSEAIDTAIRTIWRFWDLEDQPRRRILLSREYAYHGSTVAAASLGAAPGVHAMAEAACVAAGDPRGDRSTPDEMARRAADALEQRILALDPERIAAFFAEPVQVAGGVIASNEGYWSRIQEICRRYDVLLVADETECAFGRTGRWFGCDTSGIQPDLMTVGSSITSGYLPLSATLVGDRVAGVIERRGGMPPDNDTAAGHPAACAVGSAALHALEQEGLADRTREDTGPYLARCLQEALAGRPLVREVRGVGLLFGVALQPPETTGPGEPAPADLASRCVAHGLGQGILLRAVRGAVCLSPPLVITRSQIDELVEKAARAIDAAGADPPAGTLP